MDVMDLPTLHEGGHFISAKVSRVVEAIHDYSNGELEVRWCPPSEREPGVAAFQIWHVRNTPTGRPYVAFVVNSEEEFDERVLMRVMANDQRNGLPSLSEYEAWEKAQQEIARRKRREALEEAADIAYHVLRSPKSKYVVNKDLVFRDGGPSLI